MINLINQKKKYYLFYPYFSPCYFSFHLVGYVELARKIKGDGATVQRIIKNLIAIGIVGRKGLNMKRGRKYVYFAITDEKLKEILMARIDEYYKSLKKRVNLIK